MFGEVMLFEKILFGVVETFLIIFFIINFSDIKFNFDRIIMMAICCLAIVLTIRSLTDNFLVLIIGGALAYYFIIWVFTGEKGIKVMISICISYIILLFCEPLVIFMFSKKLDSLNTTIAYFLSGFPHLVIFLLAALFIKRVKRKNG